MHKHYLLFTGTCGGVQSRKGLRIVIKRLHWK